MTDHVTRDPKRMVAFADAVVAIALTLLILPLVTVAETLCPGQSVAGVLHSHVGLIASFALTFMLISRLWWVHYQVFEAAASYDGWILAGTLGWLLAIVVLPFGARLVAADANDRAAAAIYVGALLTASLFLALLGRHFTRCRWLTDPDADLSLTYRIGPAPSSGCLAAIFVIALISPQAWYWCMTILVLPTAVLRWMQHRNRHPTKGDMSEQPRPTPERA